MSATAVRHACPIVAACWLALAGCAPDVSDADAARAGTALPGVLVSATWLAQHAGRPDLVVLDAREARAYDEGHVPGAASLPYAAMFDARDGRTHLMAPVGIVNTLLGDVGVDMETTVVVYSDGDYRPAAWMFLVLEAHGHSRAAVLEGGLASWTAAGGLLEETRSSPGAAARFVAEPDPDRLADALEIMRAIHDQSVVLVDARSYEEYTGDRVKEGLPRAGHIPTAINLPYTPPLVSDAGVCTTGDLASLTGAMSELYGELRGKKVFTYCNTGRSAAVNYLVLRSLGVDAAVYDGSWTEWSMDPTLPVQIGPGNARVR